MFQYLIGRKTLRIVFFVEIREDLTGFSLAKARAKPVRSNTAHEGNRIINGKL